MYTYYVEALVHTQRTFLKVNESFKSDLTFNDFEKWLIGYLYSLMQGKKINDRYVKIVKLKISYTENQVQFAKCYEE